MAAPGKINASLERGHFPPPGLRDAFSLKTFSELENSYGLFWWFY